MTNPIEFLQALNAYWTSHTLMAAVDLGIVPAVGESRDTAAAIASRIQADERGTAALLDALTALNLFTKEHGHYRVSSLGWQCLHPASPTCLADIVRHHRNLADGWLHLAQTVRSGRPHRPRVHTLDDQQRRDFLLGMFNLAALTAPHVLQAIPLHAHRSLLDLGGGPGAYAIHFCQHNPALQAVVLDLPATRPTAEAQIARAGLSERIRFQAGDFLTDDLGGPYDLIWASHILHGESPAQAAALIQRAAAALAPGGTLVIHEFILEDDRTGPLYPALFSLNMLLGTEQGQAFTRGEISRFLEEAGLTRVSWQPLPGPSSLISAVLPLPCPPSPL
jgi:SAM-dependent methyltransferase